MLQIVIAGQTVKYKNAPDLNQKVGTLILEVRAKRLGLDEESKSLRKQERSLEKFLGQARDVSEIKHEGGLQ